MLPQFHGAWINIYFTKEAFSLLKHCFGYRCLSKSNTYVTHVRPAFGGRKQNILGEPLAVSLAIKFSLFSNDLLIQVIRLLTLSHDFGADFLWR